MNFQAVRSKFEAPLATAYGGLSPAVPIYFDNLSNVLANAEDEFVHVNLQFGEVSESSLTTMHDQIRGSIVVRVFTEKGKGPARSQTLINTAYTTLQTLNDTAKTASGVYARTGSITGPRFDDGGDAQSPFFIALIETSFQATFIS
jgi:hypothetical protein|tara:strand:+ start:1131 stop:1568 length:438 start_codon:yes stop_codon:yes gene_type:complete